MELNETNRVRRWLRRLLQVLLVLLVGIPAVLVGVYRFLPPPGTPLMLIRKVQGAGIDKHWVPLSEISPHVVRAVIASEDARFCEHWGFDFQAIDNAIDRYEAGGKVLGASTISMQTAKNLFLWPGRTFLRKGMEAYLTLWLEGLWSKERILEVYLNIAEWGPGIYGVDAAAHKHFNRSARAVTTHQAALLAAVLPSPRKWSPAHPSAFVEHRAGTIGARMRSVELGSGGEVCD